MHTLGAVAGAHTLAIARTVGGRNYVVGNATKLQVYSAVLLLTAVCWWSYDSPAKVELRTWLVHAGLVKVNKPLKRVLRNAYLEVFLI